MSNRMNRMVLGVAIALAVGLAATAFARDDRGTQKGFISDQCKSDAQKLCQDEVKDKDANKWNKESVLKCLSDNKASLTDRCRSYVEVLSACDVEADRYCEKQKYVEPFKCLSAHRVELSNECKTTFDNWGPGKGGSMGKGDVTGKGSEMGIGSGGAGAEGMGGAGTGGMGGTGAGGIGGDEKPGAEKTRTEGMGSGTYGTDPQHGTRGLGAGTVSEYDADDCKSDLDQFCKDVSGKSDQARCLDRHRQHIAADCAKSLK